MVPLPGGDEGRPPGSEHTPAFGAKVGWKYPLLIGWVDTHCHLQLDGRDPAELLSRADEVDWVVVPGIDSASSQSALELARRNPHRVRATVGLHPHHASQWGEERERIVEMARGSVAVGETGLDFYRNLASPDVQRQAFGDQVEMAIELDKPLIVHCRDAFADVHSILESSGAGPRSILHCWTGGRRWTRRFLDLGVTFSYAGPVAFETGETVRLGAALVPPERAMVETDTPYLAPPPHRHQPNEPAWVALVGAALAEIWGLPIEEVARLTARRAAEVFGR